MMSLMSELIDASVECLTAKELKQNSGVPVTLLRGLYVLRMVHPSSATSRDELEYLIKNVEKAAGKTADKIGRDWPDESFHRWCHLIFMEEDCYESVALEEGGDDNQNAHSRVERKWEKDRRRNIALRSRHEHAKLVDLLGKSEEGRAMLSDFRTMISEEFENDKCPCQPLTESETKEFLHMHKIYSS